MFCLQDIFVFVCVLFEYQFSAIFMLFSLSRETGSLEKSLQTGQMR